MKSESWDLIRHQPNEAMPKGMYHYKYLALGGDVYECFYCSNTKTYTLLLPDTASLNFKSWDDLIECATEYEIESFLDWPRIPAIG